MKSHSKVLKNPEPIVVVKDLSDSAIHLAIRPWSKNEDFGEVSSDILENCKAAFDKKGIIIQPFVRENSK
jgi:small conductance mechanosensitive channel